VKHTTIIVVVGFALVAALPSIPAHALAGRTFVSPSGSDGNPCTLALPCRNLQAALFQTNPGGEISILGTAGYSGGATFTIDRAISIVNPGAFEAGISPPSGGIGIVINAGPNDAVSLRGLTIEGGGAAQTGIQFNTGKSLTVQDCIIRHVTSDGIDFVPNATGNLLVSNTLVADNADVGIFVNPTGSGTVTAIFNRVEVSNNSGEGIYLWGANSTGTIKATVAESVVAHNANAGFFVDTGSGFAATTLTVFHSVSANNVDGIAATGTGATLRLAQTEVTGNSTAGWIANAGGVIASYGDNYIDGNGTNTGSLTPIGRQ
jgi:hypothetical protein